MGLSQECKVSLTFENKCNSLHFQSSVRGNQLKDSGKRSSKFCRKFFQLRTLMNIKTLDEVWECRHFSDMQKLKWAVSLSPLVWLSSLRTWICTTADKLKWNYTGAKKSWNRRVIKGHSRIKTIQLNLYKSEQEGRKEPSGKRGKK